MNLTFLFAILTLTSCNFVSEVGETKAQRSSGENETIVVESERNDGSSGASVVFNSGDFEEGTEFEIQEGGLVASPQNLESLGLPEDTSLASSSVNISSNNSISDVEIGKLEVSLPIGGTQLALADDGQGFLVVMYHVVDENGKFLLGAILPDEYQLVDEHAVFKAKGLGNYQAVYLPSEITEPVAEVETEEDVQTAEEYAANEDNQGNNNSNEGAPSATATSGFPTSLTVTAKYPTNGSNWGDYIRTAAGDVDCNYGTPTFDTDCFHGGEKRKVEVDGVSSCDSLNASDSLAAFDWFCDDSSGTATFYGTLKPFYGLNQLIDFTSAQFKNNHVTVNSGTDSAQSSPAKWWTNPIMVLSSPGDLTASGTIYIVNSNYVTTGNRINADKISVVVQDGNALTSHMTASNTCLGSSPALLCVEGNYAWVEGKFDAATHAQHAVEAENRKFIKLRNVETVDSSQDGIRLNDVKYSRFENLKIYNSSQSGLLVVMSIDNVFSHIDSFLNSNSGTDDAGIRLTTGSWGNVFREVKISTNLKHGLNVEAPNNRFFGISSYNNVKSNIRVAAADNTFVNIVSAGGQYAAASSLINFASGSNNSFMANVTSAFQGGAAPAIDISDQNSVFMNIHTGNHADKGLKVNSDGAVIDDYTAAWTALAPFEYNTGSSDTATLSGAWHLEGGSTCLESSGTHASISSSACVVGAPLDQVNTSPPDPANSFQAHSSGDNIVFLSNTTWTFGTLYEVLALADKNNDGGVANVWINAAARGVCENGDLCTKFDFSLRNTDSAYRHSFPCPDDDEYVQHTFNGQSTRKALKYAVELTDEYLGNGDGDGLCETGENCLISPNRGAYQGHGAIVPADEVHGTTLTCLDADANDGTDFSGVKLFKYEFNGH